VGEDLAKALAGIDRLINSDRTRNIMAGVDAFVNAPELRQSVANLERALGSFDAAMRSTKSLADNAEGRIEPMYEGFMGATRGLEQALSDTRDLMESAKGAISEDSELRERSNRVMEELEAAATAVRILADYLERHPEALIKGKSKFGDDR
jgi:paraquat-inducible protein B